MTEVCLKVDVPEDLVIELGKVSKEQLSRVVNRALKEKLSKITRFEGIVEKSKMSQEKASEISDRINKSLSKRYDELYRQTYG